MTRLDALALSEEADDVALPPEPASPGGGPGGGGGGADAAPFVVLAVVPADAPC